MKNGNAHLTARENGARLLLALAAASVSGMSGSGDVVVVTVTAAGAVLAAPAAAGIGAAVVRSVGIRRSGRLVVDVVAGIVVRVTAHVDFAVGVRIIVI